MKFGKFDILQNIFLSATNLHVPYNRQVSVKEIAVTWTRPSLSLMIFYQNILLIHWGRDKKAAIFQTIFSNAFSWMKMYKFRLRFHWNFFQRVQITIFHRCFRYWLGASQATSHYLKQWWLVDWHIYASLGLNVKHRVFQNLVLSTRQQLSMFLNKVSFIRRNLANGQRCVSLR